MRLKEFVQKQFKLISLILGFMFVESLGFLRYLTGPEYALSIFFLLPIGLTAWFAGRWAGIAMSFAGAVTWLIADLKMENSFSHPLIPFINETFRLSVFLIITFIVSRLKTALEHEKALALTDYLTGIANRRAFFEEAGTVINRSRENKSPLTVVFMDLDNFKKVNDSLGHQVGDDLLRLVAGFLHKNVRATDVAARFGGDEFIILLPETGADAAQAILSRLHDELTGIMKENNWPVTFSLGVITFQDSPGTVDEIIQKADTLMYDAKQDGKNKINYMVVNG